MSVCAKCASVKNRLLSCQNSKILGPSPVRSSSKVRFTLAKTLNIVLKDKFYNYFSNAILKNNSVGLIMAHILGRAVYMVHVLFVWLLEWKRHHDKNIVRKKRLMSKISMLCLSLWFGLALVVLSDFSF